MSGTEAAGPLSKDVLLVFLPGAEDTEWTGRIAKRHPGLEIIWFNAFKPGNEFTRPEEFDQEMWHRVTILATYLPPPAHLVPKVRYIQLISAGADKWPSHPKYQDERVLFCTANGAHAPQIAEWVIGTWLSHGHKFQRYASLMETGKWEQSFDVRVQDSPGLRMGILGYGAIGRQCARLGSAMGLEVYAYTRNERTTPESKKDDSYCVPGTGDQDGLLPAKWFHGPTKESVNDFLAQDLDLLVISLPLTPETQQIISEEQFEILSKKKTFVSNIGRGGHINQEALIKALETGQIRGAALDVTDPEPLPSDHPLWKAPNLLITPHISWKSLSFFSRLLAIIEANLENLATDKPLINVINRKLHY
ncbi:Uu.00g021150.m01.CDS01 [Anthostomella pinea]|uniref:Uu.00g021150.m01.CDS01 n=1 Tax=Anthostomella pinea TaxID=933095 RepID=A0AAI8VZM0_9PEZI|nr:Uu.00g021150.m01.CDS01 [Anthostomella pinea]